VDQVQRRLEASVTASSAQDVVEARNLSELPRTLRALTEVNQDIAAGAIHGHRGRNGSGESLLIKTLVGVHQGELGGEFRVAEIPSPWTTQAPW
jgi:ABC-type sugar transport system ATPase subunit